ncbi:MAG: amino acid racemase [Acidobacteriales bacterium]|nr:amino acid racemase [Terriglobales bacterium]
MKTLGIIGGIGPESTIEYYRFLIAAYRQRQRDGSYPPMLINSIDLKKMLDLIVAGKLAEVTEYLAGEVNKLAEAGAQVGLMASNTPHIVFDGVQRHSRIPLVSIVEAACDEAQHLGLKRLGLLGTRITMQGRFYPGVFSKAGITLVPPTPDEQDYVNEKYMGELVKGIILPETRRRLLEIVDSMQKREQIQGVILAGTELPLILRGANSSIPFLDTTRIHVEAVMAKLME